MIKMVIIEDIKNSKTIYEHINNITFLNSNTSVCFDNIISFHDSDLDIEIETYFSDNRLQRGWVGDIYYETTCGRNVMTYDNVDITYKKCIKDALLARVNSSKNDSEGVIFTYMFLKY